MADGKPKSGSPPAPSFYSKAGEMAAAESGKPAAGAGTPAGQAGEKVKNVKVLLEVFEKMDKQEQEPDAKGLIQQMADLAKQYMQKLEGAGSKPTSVPATGEAGSGGAIGTPPPDVMGAGAGAGPGAGAGVPQM